MLGNIRCSPPKDRESNPRIYGERLPLSLLLGSPVAVETARRAPTRRGLTTGEDLRFTLTVKVSSTEPDEHS